MTSFSRSTFDESFDYMSYLKSRFKKDSLLTNATLLRVALVYLRARVGERLHFCTFKIQSNEAQVKMKTQLVLVMARTDS